MAEPAQSASELGELGFRQLVGIEPTRPQPSIPVPGEAEQRQVRRDLPHNRQDVNARAARPEVRCRARRGLDLHTRNQIEPVRVRCRRSRLYEVESQLRFLGVRIVDCRGAIIAPTLLDFEEELDREPVRVRQSYDDA